MRMRYFALYQFAVCQSRNIVETLVSKKLKPEKRNWI